MNACGANLPFWKMYAIYFWLRDWEKPNVSPQVLNAHVYEGRSLEGPMSHAHVSLTLWGLLDRTIWTSPFWATAVRHCFSTVPWFPSLLKEYFGFIEQHILGIPSESSKNQLRSKFPPLRKRQNEKLCLFLKRWSYGYGELNRKCRIRIPQGNRFYVCPTYYATLVFWWLYFSNY